MSQENVEIVKRAFQAYNAGDRGVLEELYDPGIVWHHAEGWPEPGPSVGQEAVLREIDQLRAAWRELDRLEPVRDFIGTGDRVVVRALWRGSGSGPDVTMEFSYVFTLRKGRIITMQTYWDHAEALESVGLSE